METIVNLRWKDGTWPNRRFLTLLCDHDSIRMLPETAYYIESPQSEQIKWSLTSEKFRLRLFQKINTIVTPDGVDSVVKRITFCQEGVDVELFSKYDEENMYWIRRYIKDYVQEALETIDVKCHIDE